MKKIVLASIAALLASSLLFSVHTASAALAVDQSTTPWTWTAGESDTFHIWDSGPNGSAISIITNPYTNGISSIEEFGLYNLNSSAGGSNKLILLDGFIDSGILEFSKNGNLWSADYTPDGGSTSSLDLNSYTDSAPAWGFYSVVLNPDGTPYTSYYTNYVINDSSAPGTYEIQPDNMRASISAVPIPGAGLLLTTGLIGLAGIRTRFRKNSPPLLLRVSPSQ